MVYDLEKRTKAFSGQMFKVILPITRNDINKNVILQLIRSVTR